LRNLQNEGLMEEKTPHESLRKNRAISNRCNKKTTKPLLRQPTPARHVKATIGNRNKTQKI